MKFIFLFLILFIYGYIVFLVDPCGRHSPWRWRYQQVGVGNDNGDRGDHSDVNTQTTNHQEDDDQDEFHESSINLMAKSDNGHYKVPGVGLPCICSCNHKKRKSRQIESHVETARNTSVHNRGIGCILSESVLWVHWKKKVRMRLDVSDKTGLTLQGIITEVNDNLFQLAAQMFWKADKYRINFEVFRKETDKDKIKYSENVLNFQLRRNRTQRDKNKIAWENLVRNVTPTLWTYDPSNAILKQLFAAYDGKTKTAIEMFRSNGAIFYYLRYIMTDCGFIKDDGDLKNYTRLKNYMHNLWFGENNYGGSGFRHVFVGSVTINRKLYRTGLIVGQHIGLRLVYLQNEQTNYIFKYAGFIGLLHPENPEEEIGRVCEIQYYVKSHGTEYWKDSGSATFGTSVAFDFAVYTLAVAARPDQDVKFYYGDCTPVIVRAALNSQQHLRLAYTGPWFEGNKKKNEDCPPYVRAKKWNPGEMTESSSSHVP